MSSLRLEARPRRAHVHCAPDAEHDGSCYAGGCPPRDAHEGGLHSVIQKVLYLVSAPMEPDALTVTLMW